MITVEECKKIIREVEVLIVRGLKQNISQLSTLNSIYFAEVKTPE